MSETGDGMNDLRIPYEKIKFGKKIESQGFGTVFRGEFDAQKVALKRLNITNFANIKHELFAEIRTIHGFRGHRNLVALLKFCDEKKNELTLVYEWAASGTLEVKMRKRLTTIQRLEICLGAARGLHCLHANGIGHGNVTLSKILLNSDDESSSKYEAKVSGFGLSKNTPGRSWKSSQPRKEADVYSFGVVLEEVLFGSWGRVDVNAANDYQKHSLHEWVPKMMDQNTLRKNLHHDVKNEITTDSLETYVKIMCQCTMKNPEARPQMAEVVEELEKALRLQVMNRSLFISIYLMQVKYVHMINNPASVGGGHAGLLPSDRSDKLHDLVGAKPENHTNLLEAPTNTENAEKENGDNMNVVPEEITTNLKSNEGSSKSIGKNELLNINESKIILSSSNSDTQGLLSNPTKEKSNGHIKQIMNNTKLVETPQVIVTQESKSCASDPLLPKSPDKQKSSTGSRNCCSWWRFISDRVVLYRGLFWNNLITWMTGSETNYIHDDFF